LVKFRPDCSQPSHSQAGVTRETSISSDPENPAFRPFLSSACPQHAHKSVHNSVDLQVDRITDCHMGVGDTGRDGRGDTGGATRGDTGGAARGDTGGATRAGRHGRGDTVATRAGRYGRGDTGRHARGDTGGGDREPSPSLSPSPSPSDYNRTGTGTAMGTEPGGRRRRRRRRPLSRLKVERRPSDSRSCEKLNPGNAE